MENLIDVKNGKRVILLNRIYILSKSIDDIFPFPGEVFINPLEMISERGFPLLRPFSSLISSMIDGGILNKLYKDFYYNATILENIRNRTRIQMTQQIVLTIEHLNGAFGVLSIGLVASLIAFACECLASVWWNWQQMKKRRRIRHPISRQRHRRSKKKIANKKL